MARPRKNAVKKQDAHLAPQEVPEIPVEERPYLLPKGWKWVRLIHGFAECLDSFRKPVNSEERQQRQGTIPYYGATGQVGWIDDYLTNEHLVLVGEDGAPFLDKIKNKAYIIDGKSWVNNHAHILRSFFGRTGNKYLMHYLNMFNYKDYVNGTTRLKLTQANLNRIPIPLPPFEEQERIIDHIESLFAKLDEAKEHAEAVLDGFETRKAAILNKAFTGELTEKWRGETDTKKESWKKMTVGEICHDVKVGIVIKPSQYYTDSKNGTPTFRSANVRENHVDNFDWVYINNKGMKDNKRSIVHVGDVLVVRSGNPGTACVVTEEFDGYNAIDILIAVPNQLKVLPQYLCLFTNSPFGKESIAAGKRGMALAHFNVKSYSALSLVLPTIPEQQEIVNILDILLTQEQQAKDAAENVLEQIELLKKSILARAFRGELTSASINNPTD